MQSLRLVLMQLSLRRIQEAPTRVFPYPEGWQGEEVEEGRPSQAGGVPRVDPCDARSLPERHENREVPVHPGA